MTTTRQDECLQAIRNHWSAFGKSPTRTEVGRALGISKVSAHLLIDKLERAGLVVTHPGVWRNIEVTDAGAKV